MRLNRSDLLNALALCCDKGEVSQELKAMKLVRSAVLGVLGAVCSVAFAAAAEEKRVALVIGNSDYQTVSRLTNPVKDANAAARLFQNAGFKVFLRTDLGNMEFRSAIRGFLVAA